MSTAALVIPLLLLQPRQEPAPVQVFELSLREAQAIALERDLGLKIEDLASDVARFTYAGSWGAFDPVLTATATLTDSEFEAQSIFEGTNVIDSKSQRFDAGLTFPLTTGGSLALGFDTQNQKTTSTAQLLDDSSTDNLSLSLRQPLLRGAWRDFATARQQSDELAWQKQLHHERQVRQELLLRVENDYWDLVAAREQLAVADQTIELGRVQLDQNRRRLDAGVGTDVDVLQAEANVAVRVQERLAAEVAVREAADRLKASLFVDTSREQWNLELVPSTPLVEEVNPLVPPWEAALAVALEERPELTQRRLDILIAQIEVARTTSEEHAQLDLVLSSSSRGFDADSSRAFEEASQWDFPTHSASLEFSLPLNNRSARNSARIARARLRQAHLECDRTQLSVATEVRNAVRQVLFQAESVGAARSSLALARRQLEAEEARLREGLSTTFQVLEFQQQLSEALSAERRARSEFLKAQAALRKAQGLTGESSAP